jgi:hypothetical protein
MFPEEKEFSPGTPCLFILEKHWKENRFKFCGVGIYCDV